MSKIDYSKLHSSKKPSHCGHSVEGSFYLQKTQQVPGRYKPYYRYVTADMRIPVIGTQESPIPKDKKG